jgi:hypothetical protein
MESLLPILINTVAGGGGGFLANMLKKNGLSVLMNVLAGAVGGNALPALAGMAGLFGDAAAGDSMSMVTSAITALVGGGAGSLLGGLVGGKKAA